MIYPYKAVKLSEHVYWVGAIDWELSDFHGYATERGSTYNAFLILADKVTLIDTVKAPFTDELLSRISSVIDPLKIDYIISNHAEPDHTGALPEVIRRTNPEKIFASPKGVETINAYLQLAKEVEAVKNDQELNLGNMKLKFYDSKMIHWPDSMFTYLDTDGGVLFPNDAFGMHLASAERFADELDDWVVRHETAKYFANILWPMSGMVSKVLNTLKKIDKPISIIAPDHGPAWRDKDKTILEQYHLWSDRVLNQKAVIVYDTMWNSTSKMAGMIAEGLLEGGVKVNLLPLSKVNRSEVATELLEASTLLVGSPNLNGGIFPTVADVLTYIKGLKPKNHKMYGAAFGSYGWSPAATKQMAAILEEMKVESLADPLQVKWKPDENAGQQCYNFGLGIANKMKEMA